MFKTIKKLLLLSLFVYSSIFSMRQVVQNSLTNLIAQNQVAQAILAKVLIQKKSFFNSSVTRCPVDPLNQMYSAVNDEVKSETTAAYMTADESTEINNQDFSGSHLKGFRIITENKVDGYISLYSDSDTNQSSNKGMSSPIDNSQMRHHYNNKQAEQHFSKMLHDGKVEHQQKLYLESLKLEISSGIQNFPIKVQDKIFEITSSYCSLSHHELLSERTSKAQELGQLESQLRDLAQQNNIASNIYSITKNEHCYQSYNMPDELTYSKDRCTTQELQQYKKALDLKIKIEAIKEAIQECNWRIRHFEQEAYNFVSNLEKDSVETLEKTITDLTTKKDAIDDLIIRYENEFNQLNNKLADIDAQLSSKINKCKEFFKIDHSKNNLMREQKSLLEAEQQKINRQLQFLHEAQKKYNGQIEQAQKVVSDKKLQKTQLLEKQEQERLASYQKMVQDQHDRCDFNILNSPGHEVEDQWLQRQEALTKTIEQNYVQYYQEYQLTPQVEAFLAIHGVDSKNLKTFFGTALQQELHGEMCDIFSKAAIMQAQFPYQKNLLTTVVNFADAAHDANKNNQILLASQLLDVDCYLLKLNHEIIEAVTPYAQAAMYEMVHSVTDIAYMATHPAETIQGLGKALYYVLETASLNFSEVVTEYPETYEPMRDARNAEIIAGLKHLGDQIANSTGPERFGALVRFGSDFVVPGKIIHAVGEVCGFVKTQAKVMRTLEGVASIAEEQGLTQELIQAAEKLKVATQENITKSLATELIEADKNIAIYNKDGSLLKRCKILPKTEVIDRLAKCGWKISKEDPVLYHNVDYYLKQANAKMPKIEDALLKEYKKMTQFVDNPELSVCMDIEHTVTAKYELVLDSSETFYKVELKGGHLAGTMDKLVQEKLVEIIGDVAEFGNGCKEYRVKDLLSGTKFTHTEFPPHWSVEKIAQETRAACEKAIKNGSLNDKKNVTVIMTQDGFELKIVTNPQPDVHACESIENTVNRHIITARPDKG